MLSRNACSAVQAAHTVSQFPPIFSSWPTPTTSPLLHGLTSSDVFSSLENDATGRKNGPPGTVTCSKTYPCACVVLLVWRIASPISPKGRKPRPKGTCFLTTTGSYQEPALV